MSKHIDTRDLPSDPLGYLAGLRRQLVNVRNNARGDAARIDLLKRTLQCVLDSLPEVDAKDIDLNAGMPIRVTPEMLRERAAKRKAAEEKAAAPKAPAKKKAPKTEEADS